MGSAGLIASVFACADQHSRIASVYGYPLLALSFSALVLAGVSHRGFFGHLRVPFAKPAAMLAFSFYLTHKSIIHLSRKWMIDAGLTENSYFYPLGIFVACLATSLALYLLVEKPGLVLRDRICRTQAG